MGEVDVDAAGGGAFADHDVELVIFEGGVEDFFHYGAEAVDFVDEEDVMRLEVGEQGGEVAGAFEHGAAGLPQVHAELFGDDVGEGGFAQAGRTEEEGVVEGFAALFGGGDEDAELLFGFGLADVVGESFGAQGAFELLFLVGNLAGGDEALGFGGGEGVGLEHGGWCRLDLGWDVCLGWEAT